MIHRASVTTASILAAVIEIAARQGVPARTAPPAGLVTAHVVVTVGDAMAPVSNLTADDFELWSDADPMSIQRFSSEPEDLSMVLLIDASSSALESWDVSTDSLMAFVSPIDTGLVANLAATDRLGLGVFGRQVRFGAGFGADAEAISRIERDALRMDSQNRYGPSPIWDAVDAATDVLAARAGQRSVLLMTDGKATGNHKSLSAVIDHAMQSDVAVSVIGRGAFDLRPDATANAPATNLKRLADATGGTFLDRVMAPLNLTFARTLNQLHHTYVLGFVPPAQDGAAHRLQVRVKKVGAQAHVRNQYWAGRTP